MHRASDDENTFLRALFSYLQVGSAVYVPKASPGIEIIVQEALGRDTADRDPLRAIGLEWLSGGSAAANPIVTVAGVRDADGRVVGALVLARDGTAPWTADEHELLSFAAEFYAPLWDDRAVRLAATAFDETPADLDARDLELGMRAAPGNGELYLVYQPEIDLPSGAIVAVEALLRWLHPRLGAIGPDSFIAHAERSDLINIIGSWVIGESVREFASWSTELPGLDITLRINVSPAQLGDIVADFEQALARYEQAGTRICVELTEGVLASDMDALAATLHELKGLGITAALDDLGAGFSSLGRLRRLPVDFIKLDRSLVAGIDTDARAQAIVGSLVELAATLDVGVIAEGVETAAERAALIALGCTRAQGHYLGLPMSGRLIRPALRERGRGVAG